MTASAEVRLIDEGYLRESCSLLYQAHRYTPTFAYLFESDRPGYEQRVRAVVRELLGERLIGAALISRPQRRLEITESWSWRMRMLLTAGFRCTRRYLDYHEAVIACLPPGAYHILPLIGVRPKFQGRHYGEQLLGVLHRWCAVDSNSRGIVLDTGDPHHLDFLHRQGYQEVGQVELGPVREYILIHPNPQPLREAGI
ncbi:GNAT family N-acetyltransferase [Azorhizophilus paspali]|uniref:GNAT family N-acetyltransferase n=1 Tax=Azorhizophilus paspali TaxID=69963 RepID=A0ABV6SRI9_AZOPA